jgi:hypothetical protein
MNYRTYPSRFECFTGRMKCVYFFEEEMSSINSFMNKVAKDMIKTAEDVRKARARGQKMAEAMINGLAKGKRWAAARPPANPETMKKIREAADKIV